MKPTDKQLVDLLTTAFASDYDGDTLSQCKGHLETARDGDILLLAAGDVFYSVPISLNALRTGITQLTTPPRQTHDDDGNPMTYRPRGVSPHEWRDMGPKGRAARAMFEKTEEWDFRGGLSDSKPVAIPQEDLAIVARVMTSLGRHEMESLVRIAREAADEHEGQ